RQRTSEAAPSPLRTPPPPIRPANVGVGIATQQGLRLDCASPMNAPSVSGSLTVSPQAAMHIAWSEDARHAHVTPVSRWQTDTRYQLYVPADAQLANGPTLDAPLSFGFTTVPA